MTDNPAPDPVIYLEGGPGGESLETLAFVFEDSFSHLLADRDVIFFDQRGIGFSDPSLECPEIRDLTWELIDQILEPEEFNRLWLDALDECRQRLVGEGADLGGFNSAESASDLAALRSALGYDTWNLYGISYGTRLALTVMRDHPEGLRSVVLDSAVPLEVNLYGDTPASVDRGLQQLFDGCAADPACDSAYPNLDQVFLDTINALDAEPIVAQVSDIWEGRTYDAVFDGPALAGIVFQSLYSDEIIPILPRLITDVSNGETYELALLTSTFLANGEFVSVGMNLSVQCNEEAVFTNREETIAAIAEFPYLEDYFATSSFGPAAFDVCDAWGAGVADPIEDQPVLSSVPALVLSGQYDPITPPAWGRQVADTLEMATYVNIPSGGHGPSAGLECPQSLVRSFLTDPTADLDTACVEEMGPPVFEVPGGPAADVALVPFSQDWGAVTVTGVRPEEWEEQGGLGVWARLENGLDQTALLQQFAPGVDGETLATLLAGQLGIEGVPEVTESRQTDLGEWSIYEADITGTPTAIGVADTSAGAAVVLLIASPAEFDSLKASVFYPAVDALAVE